MDLDKAIGFLARSSDGKGSGMQSSMEDIKTIAIVYKCLSATVAMHAAMEDSSEGLRGLLSLVG